MSKLTNEVKQLHNKVKKLKAYYAFECHVLTTSESPVNSLEYLEDIISYAQITVEEYRDYDLNVRSVRALENWINEAEQYVEAQRELQAIEKKNKIEIGTTKEVELIDFDKEINNKVKLIELEKDKELTADIESKIIELNDEIKTLSNLKLEQLVIEKQRVVDKSNLDWRDYIYNKKGNFYHFGKKPSSDYVINAMYKNFATKRILIVGLNDIGDYDTVTLECAKNVSLGYFDSYDYIVFRGCDFLTIKTLSQHIYKFTRARAFVF